MNIKKVLKQRFSGIYDYHLHLLRKKKIKQIAKLKQLPKTEYPKMLAARYEAAIGHKLNWDNLQTYTEKMQWAKLYDKNPLKATLTDKYLVREWVEKTIGGEYLIPLLGAWDNFEDIDFSELPDRFVLKTNHGSGTNLIVKDKSKLNLKRAKRMFDDWMNIDYAYNSNFEMHYTDIKPKIIAENIWKHLRVNYLTISFYALVENRIIAGLTVEDLQIIHEMFMIWIGSCSLGVSVIRLMKS